MLPQCKLSEAEVLIGYWLQYFFVGTPLPSPLHLSAKERLVLKKSFLFEGSLFSRLLPMVELSGARQEGSGWNSHTLPQMTQMRDPKRTVVKRDSPKFQPQGDGSWHLCLLWSPFDDVGLNSLIYLVLISSEERQDNKHDRKWIVNSIHKPLLPYIRL